MAGNPYHRGGGQEGGRFTSAAEAGAQGMMSEKALRAKLAQHQITDRAIQRYAEENELEMARALGGASFKDGEPVDVVVPDETGRVAHGIELKTIVFNSNAKITMKGDALARKRAWARREKATFHTVVIDDSQIYGGGKGQRTIYYRRGAGSFRIKNMYRVTGGWDEVKSLLSTPTRKLPPGGR